MNYKAKSKDELLLEVYKLEVTANKSKARINKLEDIINQIKQRLIDWRESNFFKKLVIISKIINDIINIINTLEDDNRTTDKPA